MKDFLNGCYDEEGNYNPGMDPVAWIEAAIIMVMGLCLCMITRGI